MLVRDGSETIQCVVVKSVVSEETFEAYEKLGLESSLIVKGTVSEDKRSPLGYELQVSEIRILQIAEEYPIAKKEHGIEFLLDHRHIWLRSKKQYAIFANSP